MLAIQCPARLIGFDSEVLWLQAGGQPVASVMHQLQPATTSELLTWQVRGYIDARMTDDPLPGRGPRIVPPTTFSQGAVGLSDDETSRDSDDPATALPNRESCSQYRSTQDPCRGLHMD